MAKTKYLINNLTSGEQTPKLRSRTELKAYRNGAQEMTNVQAERYGGCIRRGGSGFIDRVKDESSETHLFDFVYSETQAYNIIAGDLYFWFTLGGSLLTETTINVTATASSGGLIRVTTDGAHGYSNGDYVRIVGVLGTVEANDVWVVTGKTSTTIDLTGSTFTNVWISGGTVGKVVEVTTPYLEADLAELDWSQDGDVLHFTGGNYAPRTLTRTTATSFTLAAKQFAYPPTIDANTTATTLTLSAASPAVGDSITVTASAAVFTDTELTGHINSGWRSHGGAWHITAFGSTTSVTATVTVACTGGTTPTTTWSEAEWSGVRGWPRRNAFYEQRWVTSPTTAKPQTIWGSAVGGPLDFDQSTTNSDDSFEHTVAAVKINTITWLSPQSTLLIGTAGQEFKASGPANGILTASDPIIRKQTSFGGKASKPVQVGNATLYIDQSGRRIYDIVFDFQVDSYDGDQITLLAEHLFPTTKTITRIVYQQNPGNVVWMVRSDGVLISCTYLPKQEILAFGRHVLGGTDTVVESISTIPNVSSGDDDVYLIVKRTINGATHRYIERLDSTLYVDSGVSGTHSPAASALAGLTHLVGETVDIVGDDSPYNQQVVSATGTVTLDTTENTITSSQVGLPIPTPTLIPNEIDPFIFKGETSLGMPKRPARLYVRTLNTPSIIINGKRVASRSTQDLMDTAPPTNVIDDWDLTELGYDDNAKITITQDSPLPMNILGIFGEYETGGE